MLQKTLLPLALVVAFARAAEAQSVPNVLAEAGLLGTWANDCSRPAGGGNIHTIYAVGPAGEATVTYSHGPAAAPTVNVILSAKRVAGDDVGYHQENRANGARLDIVVRITGTHIRVWSSIRSTGQTLVANGKFVSDGVESPLQAKCP